MLRSVAAGLLLLLSWVALGPAQPPGGPPPEPGTVIPPFVREPLKLTPEQQEKVAALEQDMKARLKKVLTEKQLKLFEDTLRQGPPKPGGAGKPPPKGPMAEPGLVVPPFVTEKLQLTSAQQKQIAGLEQLARAGLAKVLTEAQKRQFNELLRQGPMGRGGPRAANPRPAGAAAGSGIQWLASLADGLQEAQRTGRPILLVAAAPHCAGVAGVW